MAAQSSVPEERKHMKTLRCVKDASTRDKWYYIYCAAYSARQLPETSVFAPMFMCGRDS